MNTLKTLELNLTFEELLFRIYKTKRFEQHNFKKDRKIQDYFPNFYVRPNKQFKIRVKFDFDFKQYLQKAVITIFKFAGLN